MSQLNIKILKELVYFKDSGKDYRIVKESDRQEYIEYLIVKDDWYYGQDYYCVYEGKKFLFKISPLEVVQLKFLIQDSEDKKKMQKFLEDYIHIIDEQIDDEEERKDLEEFSKKYLNNETDR